MTIRDDKLVNYILNNGGITLDPREMTVNNHSIGFYISVKMSNGATELKVPTKEFNKKVLDKYIEDNAFYLNKKKYFLGAWVNEGIVYLDVTTYERYKTKAMWLGKMYGQKAIWDIEKKEEVFVE